MSEKELIEKCKQGEKTAYEKLYKIYAPYMKAICSRYTGNEMLAEDVLHDGFIKVFMSVRSFQYQGEGSLKAWMSRIFCNESLAFIKQSKRLLSNNSLEELEIADDTEEIPDMNHVPQAVLMKFIMALTINYRTVFNLFVFEDMSHKEIGEKLDITEEASRARLSRAKSILTEKIKRYLAANG